MGGRRIKTLADQLMDLDDPTPYDFDPEDLDRPGQSSDDDSEGDAGKPTGREHYQAVGRGPLRKQDPVRLGKQYAGSRVSRDALEEESDDDPFGARTDEDGDGHSVEEDDDEPLDGTGEKHNRRGSGSKELIDPFHLNVRSVDDPGRDDGTSEDLESQEKRVHHGEPLVEEKPGRVEEVDDGGHVVNDLKGTQANALPDVIQRRGVSTARNGRPATNQIASLPLQEKEGDHDVDGRSDERNRITHRDELHGLISEDQEDQQNQASQGDDAIHSDSSQGDTGDSESGIEDESTDESTDESADESAEEGAGKKEETKAGDEREELRRLMATDQKTIAASLSQAAKADAVKGKAVKQQRAGFDALLNARIKLQKGLGAVNHLCYAEDPQPQSSDAVSSAESAALSLWSTLEDLRLSISNTQATGESKKRKRSPVSSATSTSSLWQRMADLESESLAHRRAVLDKWSLKVRGSSATTPNARGKLLGSSTGQQNITAVLDAQVASEVGDRTIKRSRKDSGTSDDEPIYDDTVFYQSLLRDLVEQRMSSDALTNGLDTLHIQIPSRSIHPVTGMRKDKVKKDVDTRASKGRKIRYHVHEKLQNFMAPEDRGTWTDRARDEFFASLLGKTASGLLREGDDEASAGEQSEEDVEEGGLRLFRS